jgi:hypothetical protein
MINCCMILGIIHRKSTLGGHQNLLIEKIFLLGFGFHKNNVNIYNICFQYFYNELL